MVHTPPAARGYNGPAIPNNLYTLEVRSVVLVPAEVPDHWGNLKDKLKIHWLITDLVDGDGQEVFVDDRVNNSLSDGAGGRYPPSNYYKICSALGVETENGVDSDRLVGLQCQGMVETEEEEGAWPRVTRYMRIQKGQAKAAQKAPTRAQEPNLTPSSAEVDELSDWWKTTREQGLTREEVIEKSKAMFDALPHEISGEERAELYLALIGA